MCLIVNENQGGECDIIQSVNVIVASHVHFIQVRMLSVSSSLLYTIYTTIGDACVCNI